MGGLKPRAGETAQVEPWVLPPPHHTPLLVWGPWFPETVGTQGHLAVLMGVVLLDSGERWTPQAMAQSWGTLAEALGQVLLGYCLGRRLSEDSL